MLNISNILKDIVPVAALFCVMAFSACRLGTLDSYKVVVPPNTISYCYCDKLLT
jgi:hypothetical protein